MGVTRIRSESPGALHARERRAIHWRAAFAALVCVSVAVFCVLTAVLFFASTASYTDEGEEGYAIAIASALALLAVGLCVGAARCISGLGTLTAAPSLLLTSTVTLVWASVTVAAYLVGATSGSNSDLMTLTGLTIPGALVGLLGMVLATAVMVIGRKADSTGVARDQLFSAE